MKMVVTGGGSGGHITPILAVAHELKKLNPQLHIAYVGQKGDGLTDVVHRSKDIDELHAVSAGKLRRYHGEGLSQLLDVKSMLLNLRDMGRVVRGLFESYRLLRKLRPDIIFIKGGFVGVPVGLAAAALRIPFITHDSDAIPGLANRIIARWAAKHAVALPKEVYAYPKARTITVGVPVASEYSLVTAQRQQEYRRELGLQSDAKLLFVIGGGLGAQRVNDAIAVAAPTLLQTFPTLRIVHGVGRANEAAMAAKYQQQLPAQDISRVTVVGFLHDVYRYSGAADVVVTRAGATNLAEFAVQGKACVVIPNPFLTAGHQLKNAAYLESEQSAEMVNEVDLSARPEVLLSKISNLLQDESRRALLGSRLQTFGHPNAARELAELLLAEAGVRR